MTESWSARIRAASGPKERLAILNDSRNAARRGADLVADREAIANCLKDPDDGVRIAAVKLVDAMRRSDTLARRSGDWSVRGLVAALSLGDASPAADVLKRLLAEDPGLRPTVRVELDKHPFCPEIAVLCGEIPERKWKWGDQGVRLAGGKLVWFRGSSSREQTFADFLRSGIEPDSPSIVRPRDVPHEVFGELHRLLGHEPPAHQTAQDVERELDEQIAKLAAGITEKACEVCSRIPHASSADLDEGETVAPLMTGLVDKGDYLRCPSCGALYAYERDTSNEAGWSYDVERLVRVTPQQLRAELRRRRLGEPLSS